MTDKPSRQPRFSLGNLRKVEFLAVAALVGFVAIVVALSLYAGLDAVLFHVRSVGLPLLLVMLGLSLINYALRAWRWQLFANGLGIRVPWGRNLLYFVAGFALTATPG